MNLSAALVNGLLLSVLLAGSVWLALRLIPRRALGAATRYVIWWIALACCVALPALFLAGRPTTPEHHTESGGGLTIAVLDLGPSPAPSPAKFQLPVAVPLRPWMLWAPVLWAASSALMLGRLLLSHFAVLRACSRARELLPQSNTRLEAWRQAAGPRRHAVRVFESADVPIPFAAGPFRRAIVLPSHLVGQLSLPDMDRIALHEAAHLARLDDWAILGEQVLMALLPWHVTIRWIAGRIGIEREIACDDRVVDSTGSPQRYAECLTRAVELCGGVRGSLAAAGMAGHRTHLSQRVELLLDPSRRASRQFRPAPAFPFAAGVLALALLFARVPQLFAFQEPFAPPMPIASVPIPQQEKIMVTPKPKRMRRKLAVATAAAALIAPAVPAQNAAPNQAQVQPVSAGRYIAFFIDTAGFTTADLQRASDAAARFMQTRMLSTDKIALMVSTGRGVMVQQDFTADRELLAAATRELRIVPEAANASAGDRWESISTAFHMLGALAEKKMFVYLGSGLPSPAGDQLRALTEDAIRANLAVYVVDVRGVIAR